MVRCRRGPAAGRKRLVRKSRVPSALRRRLRRLDGYERSKMEAHTDPPTDIRCGEKADAHVRQRRASKGGQFRQRVLIHGRGGRGVRGQDQAGRERQGRTGEGAIVQTLEPRLGHGRRRLGNARRGRVRRGGDERRARRGRLNFGVKPRRVAPTARHEAETEQRTSRHGREKGKGEWPITHATTLRRGRILDTMVRGRECGSPPTSVELLPSGCTSCL